ICSSHFLINFCNSFIIYLFKVVAYLSATLHSRIPLAFIYQRTFVKFHKFIKLYYFVFYFFKTDCTICILLSFLLPTLKKISSSIAIKYFNKVSIVYPFLPFSIVAGKEGCIPFFSSS